MLSNIFAICFFFQPPDDPYAIKKDDLVLGLRKCLAATNLFAPVGTFSAYFSSINPSIHPLIHSAS